jgi:hypothetical protein
VRGIHHEVRASAFFGVRQLSRQDGVESLGGHVATRHDALALNFRRRRHCLCVPKTLFELMT